jgi:hypothetical protein
MYKEWEEICQRRDWDLICHSYKPRVVYLVEEFEKQYPDTDSREDAACLAVASYLFGPIEDEEEMELYQGIVRRKLRDYRNQSIQ